MKKWFRFAEKIYNFQRIDDTLEDVDLILVLCSHDLRVADYTAKLFLSWYWQKIILSWWIAHCDDLLLTWWNKTEAETFADRIINLWIDKNNLICEKHAKNSWENIIFSAKKITEMWIKADKIMLVQKPYMQKRWLLSFLKQYPLDYEKVITTAPNISFNDYPNKYISYENFVNILVWDFQRLIEYPKLWFQEYTEIPSDMVEAYENLKILGYTKHLLK